MLACICLLFVRYCWRPLAKQSKPSKALVIFLRDVTLALMSQRQLRSENNEDTPPSGRKHAS